MKTLAVLILSAALTLQVMADAATILKQKARGVDASQRANDAPPAAPAPAPAMRPGQTAAQPQQAPLSPFLQEKVRRIQTALNQIKPKSTATADQKTDIKNALDSASIVQTKPTQTTQAKLIDDLAAIWPTQAMNAVEQTQLAKDICLVLNCVNLNATQLDGIYANAQTLLKYSGISEADVKKITDDLRAIATEVQKR